MANAAEKQDQSSSHDDHGPGHEMKIIVNGQEKTVDQEGADLRRDRWIAFDGNPPTGANSEFTSPTAAATATSEGTLAPGGTVKVKEG